MESAQTLDSEKVMADELVRLNKLDEPIIKRVDEFLKLVSQQRSETDVERQLAYNEVCARSGNKILSVRYRTDLWMTSTVTREFSLSRSFSGCDILTAFKIAATFEYESCNGRQRWVVKDEPLSARAVLHTWSSWRKRFVVSFSNEEIYILPLELDKTYSTIQLEMHDHDTPDESGCMSACVDERYLSSSIIRILKGMSARLLAPKECALLNQSSIKLPTEYLLGAF